MIGINVAHYIIVQKLGEGGMGDVFLAEDAKLNRQVALKFLPKLLLCDEEAKARLVYEAKAASALNHLNITAIYEIDEVESECLIYMEHVEGKPIKQLLSVADIYQTDPRFCDFEVIKATDEGYVTNQRRTGNG